jgi:hypothetical protein
MVSLDCLSLRRISFCDPPNCEDVEDVELRQIEFPRERAGMMFCKLTLNESEPYSVISRFAKLFKPLCSVGWVGLSREAAEFNGLKFSRLSSSCCPCGAPPGLESVIGALPGADRLSQQRISLPCGDGPRSCTKESRQVISSTVVNDSKLSSSLDWNRCLLTWRCSSSRLLSSGPSGHSSGEG